MSVSGRCPEFANSEPSPVAAAREESDHRAGARVHRGPPGFRRTRRQDARRRTFPDHAAARFGGFEYGYEVFVEAVAAVAAGDGSTGWVYSLGAVHQWMIGCYPVEAQNDFWDEGVKTPSPPSLMRHQARPRRKRGLSPLRAVELHERDRQCAMGHSAAFIPFPTVRSPASC